MGAVGSTVTVTALARGTATIAVSATDPGGLSATQSFQATVPNQAPEARDELPAFDLDMGFDAELVILPYFSDPDGDTLTYAAVTSDAAIATASASDSSITVTAVAPGSAMLTVTARDPAGLEVSQSAGITVHAPDPGYFLDEFATSASLENWHLIDALAEVTNGVLKLTGTKEFEQAWASRGHALTEWTATARIGRADPGTSAGLTMIMNHDRFLLYAIEFGSGVEVDGEDTNYRLYVLDAELSGWILLEGFYGKSDAIRDGPGEFTEITFAMIGRQLSLYAGANRLFSEEMSSFLPVDIRGYILTEWSHDDTVGKTALFDWFEIEGDAGSADTADGADAVGLGLWRSLLRNLPETESRGRGRSPKR